MKRPVLAVFFLIFCHFSLASGRDINPFPDNIGTGYEHAPGDLPEVCFYPLKEARWNGDKVTNKNWHELTYYQKSAFIYESLPEIEKRYGAETLPVENWKMLIMLNAMAKDLNETSPEKEAPMIDIFLTLLIKTGYAQFE